MLMGMVTFTAAVTAVQRYPHAQSKDIVVFAAVSLKGVLDEVGERFRRDTGKGITASYAASSILAKRIENGASADLFISANPGWMDYLEQRKLIHPWSRSDLLGNKLVLIPPAANRTVRLVIEPGFPLRTALDNGRLAIADPASVPAGMYAKAALENLGVWPAVASRLTVAENVRAALLLVAGSEVPLGICLCHRCCDRTRCPGHWHATTRNIPANPVFGRFDRDSANPDAATLLVYLRCAVARAKFQKAGFRVV